MIRSRIFGSDSRMAPVTLYSATAKPLAASSRYSTRSSNLRFAMGNSSLVVSALPADAESGVAHKAAPGEAGGTA